MRLPGRSREAGHSQRRRGVRETPARERGGLAAGRRSLLLAVLAAGACLAHPGGAAASGEARAVVLVSGFTTSTPFSTPSPGCAGKEGPTFAGVIAPTLKAAGLRVFTAPIGPGTPAPAPCTGEGQEAPPARMTVDSEGETDANGRRLGSFLAFLRDRYGVRKVDLVGHSDGGLWSRAAITWLSRHRGPSVRSLTTVGTPHTGTFILDAAEQLVNVKCDQSSTRERQACEGIVDEVDGAVELFGPEAVVELTRTFLATWGPKQRMGGCLVTTLAGTHVDLPGSRAALPRYYNPSDGLVGMASALALPSRTFVGTRIPAPRFPNHVVGGTFDVVHSTTEEFLSPDTETNTPAIAKRMVRAVRSAEAGDAPPCTSGRRSGPRRPAVSVPFRTAAIAGRSGRLPRPRSGDVLIAANDVVLRCGSRRQGGPQAPGIPILQVTPLRACDRPARAIGGPATLLRRVPRRYVQLEVSGKRVDVAVRGRPVRRLSVQVQRGDRWHRLRRDRRGRVRLPRSGSSASLRIRARLGDRLRTVTASATIAR